MHTSVPVSPTASKPARSRLAEPPLRIERAPRPLDRRPRRGGLRAGGDRGDRARRDRRARDSRACRRAPRSRAPAARQSTPAAPPRYRRRAARAAAVASRLASAPSTAAIRPGWSGALTSEQPAGTQASSRISRQCASASAASSTRRDCAPRPLTPPALDPPSPAAIESARSSRGAIARARPATRTHNRPGGSRSSASTSLGPRNRRSHRGDGVVDAGEVDGGGAGRLRAREHLERGLDHDAERSEASHHQLGEIEAGGVLHHLAAAADQRAAAVEEAHAENEVANAAVARAPRARHARRDGAAEGRARFDQDGIERQVLALLAERGSDLARSASPPGRSW